MLTNEDGALERTFSVLKSQQIGLGTLRSKDQSLTVNTAQHILSEHERVALFRSSAICRKVVTLLPLEASRAWVNFTLGSSDINPSEIADFFDNLKTGSLKDAFTEASIEGRWHGDGYVLLGIDDGQDWDKPVDEKRIKSFRWAEPLFHTEVTPDSGYFLRKPEYYIVTRYHGDEIEGVKPLSTFRVHRSRILRFPGNRLYSSTSYNAARNDSVLQTMYEAFSSYTQAIMSSSAMIADYNVFKYALKNLAKLIQEGKEDQLLQRFLTLQMGMSVTKGLAVDMDQESAEFISRNYSGVKDIIDILQEHLISSTDTPRHKIIGSANKVGSGQNNKGLADQMEWASCVESWESHNWQTHLRYCMRIALLSREGVTKGKLPDGWGFNFVNVMQLDPLQEQEIKTLKAQENEKNITLGIYTPYEARMSAFGGATYSTDITLNETVTKRMEAEIENPVEPSEEPTAEEVNTDAEGFTPPIAARNAARRVLKWRKEHPDEIKGMTSVGWGRASQLASGKPISLSTVKRMAMFNRHRKNYEAARNKPEFKSEPWKSAAIVAWLGWGGSSGINWAISKSNANSDSVDILHIIDDIMNVDTAVKKVIKWKSLILGIEYLPGDQRFGKTLTAVGYGHIRNHRGEDKEALDCYVSESVINGTYKGSKITRITQVDNQGDFEYKYFIGYTVEEAKQKYLELMPSYMLSAIKAVTLKDIDRFRRDSLSDSELEELADISEADIENTLSNILGENNNDTD